MRLLQGNPDEDLTLKRENTALLRQLRKGLEPFNYEQELMVNEDSASVCYEPIGDGNYFVTAPEEFLYIQHTNGRIESVPGKNILSKQGMKATLKRAKPWDRTKLWVLSLRGYHPWELTKEILATETTFRRDSGIIIYNFSTITQEGLTVRQFKGKEEKVKKRDKDGRELWPASRKTTYEPDRHKSKHFPFPTKGTIDRVTVAAELEEKERFLEEAYPGIDPDIPINVDFHNGICILPQTRMPGYKKPRSNKGALELFIELIEKHDTFIRATR